MRTTIFTAKSVCVYLSFVLAVSALAIGGRSAQAAQFPTLAGGYQQEIYAGPLIPGQEAGMAWTSGGNLLTRAGDKIIEYDPTANTFVNGTWVHGVLATHTITGLNTTGYGMTNGMDGYTYVATGSGLQRFNPSSWAAPAQTLAGTVGGNAWGITTLSDGRIAYSDGGGNSNIYVYNPSNGSNSLIYTANCQVDDIEASVSGHIALAGHSNQTLIVLTNSGSQVNLFSTAHFPDGLAFGDGVTTRLYSNNNDGTITRYDFAAPNYSGAVTATDIATGSGAYGDLAAVGPDCAFYVTQYNNNGSNGSSPTGGTNWGNNTTTTDGSIVRISAIGSDGLPYCEFEGTTTHVPEPATWLMLLAGAVTVAGRCWRRKA